MISSLFVLLLASLETALSSRCCQFLCSADECTSSPYGCKWLEEGVADELIVDGVQCRSIMWGECGECCPACPGLGPTLIEWSCETEDKCPTQPPQPPVTEAYGPMAVVEEITDSHDEDCECAATNCLEEPDYRGPDAVYMTSTISFQSITYSEDFNACCYTFRAERNDNVDCKGKNSPMKRLMIDVDCPREDFTIVETEPSSDVDYSEDGDLCYTGIRIDSECDRVCDYEICIQWNTLTAGQCPWTTSWVMTKQKGGVIAFGALDGVPSCILEDQVAPESLAIGHSHKKSNQEETIFSIAITNLVPHLYTQAQWAIMALVVGALAALYVCYLRNKAAEESKSLKGTDEPTTGYMSTV